MENHVPDWMRGINLNLALAKETHKRGRIVSFEVYSQWFSSIFGNATAQDYKYFLAHLRKVEAETDPWRREYECETPQPKTGWGPHQGQSFDKDNYPEADDLLQPVPTGFKIF